MNRRKEYQKYLKSPEWSEVRDIALDRTGGHCQFCGDFATQVHHVQYPKQFGEEHPNSTIPVCKRCHDTAHGVLNMAKELTKAEILTELSPLGGKLNYLLSDEGRVYASAPSWRRALQVPEPMVKWFETGLARVALLKKDLAGGSLEMTFSNTPVYRWHAVAEQLRAFDREFFNTGYKSRPPEERRLIEKFHENYNRLTNWGYDLQERAIAASLNARTKVAPSAAPITQDALIEVIRQAIAPRLHEHDGKLREHEVILKEIKEAVPALRDQTEFISVKQAISEKGLDPTVMPFFPRSRENLSGIVGQVLKNKGADQGTPVVARLDGTAASAPMNTYRRGAIYTALDEVIDQSTRQGSLNL